MKKAMPHCLPLLLLGGLLLFPAAPRLPADTDDPKPAEAGPPPVKRNANGEMVVTVDAATQKLIKMAVVNPTAATWQPAVKGYGRVLDPVPLVAEVADLAAARLSADASAREYERLKTLAAQDNASTRALEAAQFADARDRLAWESARTKLAGDWGLALAGRSDLAGFARQLAEHQASLVRLELPAGENLSDPPVAARLTVFPDDAHPVPAELLEFNLGVDSQTQGQILLFLVKDRFLPPGAAVTGQLSLGGSPLHGVEVPAAAVLRHDGQGWVYLQTADTEFTRHAIPLDRLTPAGWFVTGDLTTTNVIVTAGAETVLSAELSGGGFNTGLRD